MDLEDFIHRAVLLVSENRLPVVVDATYRDDLASQPFAYGKKKTKRESGQRVIPGAFSLSRFLAAAVAARERLHRLFFLSFLIS